ncbi:MAG: YggT family protein [Chloroflexi bacterium]|jgi:uncharacterized protein YggT (Ycf19 family)|nr:YggT family protein [Chloroflexota bacterium]
MVDERRVVTRTDVVAPVAPTSVSQTEVTYRSSGNSVLERLIIFLFALIQGLLILRIVLLLVAARQGNDLVALIYDVSDIFVAPFRGILGRNQIPAGSTDLDVAAIVALIGWTIVELIILGFLRVFRRTA